MGSRGDSGDVSLLSFKVSWLSSSLSQITIGKSPAWRFRNGREADEELTACFPRVIRVVTVAIEDAEALKDEELLADPLAFATVAIFSVGYLNSFSVLEATAPITSLATCFGFAAFTCRFSIFSKGHSSGGGTVGFGFGLAFGFTMEVAAAVAAA